MSAVESADRLLLERSRAALDWWEEQDYGPTSSITGTGAICLLERRMATLTGGRAALALPSATAALRVGLAALGVGPRDEVICPAYGWPAASAAVRSLGAEVRFADVDAATLTVDPDSVEELIGSRTKVVVATHLFGIPADVPALRRITDPLGIDVVEDCAQALGAELDDLPVGSLGAAAAFSFGPGKTIDAGEGGVLVLDGPERHRAAILASQHPARQRLSAAGSERSDNLSLRVHPLAAVLALHGLQTLPARLESDRNQSAALFRLLADTGHRVLGRDRRRRPAGAVVPVCLDPVAGTSSPGYLLQRVQVPLMAPTPVASRLATTVRLVSPDPDEE